jgi:hypothetical protein
MVGDFIISLNSALQQEGTTGCFIILISESWRRWNLSGQRDGRVFKRLAENFQGPGEIWAVAVPTIGARSFHAAGRNGTGSVGLDRGVAFDLISLPPSEGCQTYCPIHTLSHPMYGRSVETIFRSDLVFTTTDEEVHRLQPYERQTISSHKSAPV